MSSHRAALVSRALTLVTLASLSIGCGAASPTTTTLPTTAPCSAERHAAETAHADEAQCAASQPTWAHQAAFDRALEAVGVTEVDAANGGVPPDHAQTAADALWALLDDVSPELTNHTSLDRAENAAEGVLRERSGDAARAASTEARGALDDLHHALRPDEASPPCASERDLARAADDALTTCEGAH